MEIAEYDGAGALLRRYIPGGAIDVRVAYIEGSGTAAANIEYYHADRLGNVSALSDDVGNITDRYAYDPFGHECEVLSPAPGAPCEVGPPSTSGQLFRYTGRKYDPETGLYYYRARYYCPDCGRFLSTDPVGYEAGFNLYTYTLNDPLNNTDATGLNPGIDRRADNAFKAVRSCTASTSCTRTAKAVISTGVDFIPIVGDIKGAIEFAQNPSFLGAAAVIVGIAPGLGDVASKGLKQLDNVGAAKVFGNAQQTRKAGELTTHGSTSERIASEMAQSGEFSSVHLNQSVGTITDGSVSSGVRPDVAGVRADGTVDAVEVLSPRQTPSQMESKLSDALGKRCGTVTCVEPD